MWSNDLERSAFAGRVGDVAGLRSYATGVAGRCPARRPQNPLSVIPGFVCVFPFYGRATPVTRERDPTHLQERRPSELLHGVPRPLQLRHHPIVADEVACSDDN
jgi:hypothetical protein